MRRGARLLLVLACLAGPARAQAPAQAPAVLGIDHTPIVVGNLEKAVADFRAMGFAIKPGRFHADGIRNAHVKFADGTELELITAPAATDALTREYHAKQSQGDGPVYWGLWGEDHDLLAARLKAMGAPVIVESGALTFPAGDPLHPLFFGSGEMSPTDRPQHFAHENSALRLSGLWIGGNGAARDLLAKLGVPIHPVGACGPFGAGEDAVLPRGDVIFVKGNSRVAGARIAVKSLATAEAVMKKNGLRPRHACGGLWLPPGRAHGLWLQFVAAR